MILAAVGPSKNAELARSLNAVCIVISQLFYQHETCGDYLKSSCPDGASLVSVFYKKIQRLKVN